MLSAFLVVIHAQLCKIYLYYRRDVKKNQLFLSLSKSFCAEKCILLRFVLQLEESLLVYLQLCLVVVARREGFVFSSEVGCQYKSNTHPSAEAWFYCYDFVHRKEATTGFKSPFQSKEVKPSSSKQKQQKTFHDLKINFLPLLINYFSKLLFFFSVNPTELMKLLFCSLRLMMITPVCFNYANQDSFHYICNAIYIDWQE